MKSKSRILLVLITAILSLTVSLPVLAEIKTLAEAINKAGRQRMLTQRIVKNHCLIGMNVRKDAAAEELKKATDLFSRQLEELKGFTPTEQIKERVTKADSLWQPFFETVKKAPTKESCEALNESGEDLLRASHKVVLALSDFSGTSSGKIIDVSGRQRMLSQRIAKYHTMYAWGLAGSENMDNLNRAMVEFQGAQVLLFQSKLNTPEIKELLVQVNRSFKPVKNVAGQNKEQYWLEEVIKNTEAILQDMNTATGLYQKVAENL